MRLPMTEARREASPHDDGGERLADLPAVWRRPPPG